jgi:hypothetical protein
MLPQGGYRITTTEKFTSIVIDRPLKAGKFTFTPPAGAVQVKALPQQMMGGGLSSMGLP